MNYLKTNLESISIVSDISGYWCLGYLIIEKNVKNIRKTQLAKEKGNCKTAYSLCKKYTIWSRDVKNLKFILRSESV